MNIIQIYRQFPTNEDCLRYLEKVRWGQRPICPYCHAAKSTPVDKELRHHCNNCNTSFSVTVNTIFHKTKADLQKWFLAISLILNAKKGISARQLGRDIEVNKNTAWYMAMRIREAMLQDRELLSGIIEVDETYVGGKSRPGSNVGRGTSKTPVVGLVQRGGRVTASKVSAVNAKVLSGIVRENVDLKGSTVITDQFKGYAKLKTFVKHQTINHSVSWGIGDIHTNTIEGFWSLLKRGMVGQYHQVSVRHLQQYINEFCYRYNNRDNDFVFEQTLEFALRIK